MPDWTNHPPDDADRYTATLIRVKPGRPIRGICASPHLLGCWTHWFGGRTIPCDPPNCPACAQQATRRWHAYIHLYSPTTHHSAILELTALAARELEAYVEQHHTLRGAMLDVSRSNHRPNSTLILTATPADLQRFNLPAPLDIPAALERMWEINVKRASTLSNKSAPGPCTSNADTDPPDAQLSSHSQASDYKETSAHTPPGPRSAKESWCSSKRPPTNRHQDSRPHDAEP